MPRKIAFKPITDNNNIQVVVKPLGRDKNEEDSVPKYNLINNKKIKAIKTKKRIDIPKIESSLIGVVEK